MAARRPSVCLLCQARQSSIGRRKAATSARRRMEAVAAGLEHAEEGFLLQQPAKEITSDTQALSDPAASREKKEDLRDTLLGFEALHKQRDERLKVLRNLSNPWPPWYQRNKDHDINDESSAYVPPEATGAPVPHHVFRRIVKEVEGYKAVRQVLRAQLLRCEMPSEVLRIVAVAMQHRDTAKNLAALGEPIVRAMYRCRNNVTDPEILRTMKAIIKRFDMAKLDYDPTLLYVGLKFAARSRSLQGMKWILRLIRESGRGMSCNIFRSVIAKFSIGHRGLGEIRNGRWRREQLLQVLTGFDDCTHLPPQKQYHLGSFMIREDWQYLHGWVAVLARCKDSDSVWREWELWRECPAREKPKGLRGPHGAPSEMTTKLRGDYWFVEQMACTGDLKRAWKLLRETGLRFGTLKSRVKRRLLDEPEHATIWNEEVREAMIWKYDVELTKIEDALGVVWEASPTADDAEGVHVLLPDQTQEESLEKLAAWDFGAEEDYGFPIGEDGEDGPIVESRERALHDAEEERPREWVYAGRGAQTMSPEDLESARQASMRGRRYAT